MPSPQPSRRLLLLTLLAAPFALPMAGCVGRSNTPTTTTTTSASSVSDSELMSRVDAAIDIALHHRRLNLKDHAAWQIVHGAMAFQRDFPIEKDGELVSAIDYLLAGGTMKGWEFEPGDQLASTGRRGLRAIQAPGSKEGQGHPDQWLGYLAECGLPPEQTIVVGTDTFTLADLIAQVEWDVPRNVTQEYSWTVMGLSAYRPADYAWTASDGKTWTLEQLVEIEAGHDLTTSACGGCHRLFALAMAVNRHLAQGGKLEGGWKVAHEKIESSARRAREYQNPDGSFSSNYFERPGLTADLSLSLSATGHIFEFLTAALPQDQLTEPAMRRAAVRLCEILEGTQGIPLECGALYHAAHGLRLYRQRVWGDATAAPPEQVQVAGESANRPNH